MSIQQLLLSIDELQSFTDHSTFTQNIPTEWIESALILSTKASIRRRRLPEDQVLWLFVGVALFRGEPIQEVARRLNICSEGLASESLIAVVSPLSVSGWEPILYSGYSNVLASIGHASAFKMMTDMVYRFCD